VAEPLAAVGEGPRKQADEARETLSGARRARAFRRLLALANNECQRTGRTL